MHHRLYQKSTGDHGANIANSVNNNACGLEEQDELPGMVSAGLRLRLGLRYDC